MTEFFFLFWFEIVHILYLRSYVVKLEQHLNDAAKRLWLGTFDEILESLRRTEDLVNVLESFAVFLFESPDAKHEIAKRV